MDFVPNNDTKEKLVVDQKDFSPFEEGWKT